jgi:stage II sporulation protein D
MPFIEFLGTESILKYKRSIEMSGKKKNYQGHGEYDQPLWIRITCLALGVVMVFAILVMLIQACSASTTIQAVTNSSTPDTEISVGLFYGDTAVESLTLVSASGFSISSISDKVFFTLDSSMLAFCIDSELYSVGNTYQSEGNDLSSLIAGAYHIQISGYSLKTTSLPGTIVDNPVYINPASGSQNGTSTVRSGYQLSNVFEYAEELRNTQAIGSYADSVYVAYSNGSYYIRVGHFSTSEEASEALESLRSSMDLTASIVDSTSSGFTIINPTDRSVLCEIVTSDTAIKVNPIQGTISDLSSNVYSGSLTFRRLSEFSGKMRVVNLLSMEDYLFSIISCEVSPDYPLEAAKALAIVLRTNAYEMLNRHREDGFDVCTDSHCHIFKSSWTNISDDEEAKSKIEQLTTAVQLTEGMIVAYNGKAIHAVYSVQCGNSTISAYEALGSENYPYLTSQLTPWESEGKWTVAVEPSTLSRLLNQAGYTEIQSNIESITIDARAEKSNYVVQITFCDSIGEKVTISGSEEIRKILGQYIPSTNFDIWVSDGSDDNRYGSFVFSGSGVGSGIGFSINGAQNLALSGDDYTQIIDVYYPGCNIDAK